MDIEDAYQESVTAVHDASVILLRGATLVRILQENLVKDEHTVDAGVRAPAPEVRSAAE
jgi:hypothetical protein